MSDFDQLIQYLDKHTRLGTGEAPEGMKVISFHRGLHVQIKGEPDEKVFQELTKKCSGKGEYTDLSPLNGREHSYIEIGGWLGDQGLALRYMAIAAHHKLAKLMTPKSLFTQIGQEITRPEEEKLFGIGLCTIAAEQPVRALAQQTARPKKKGMKAEGPKG